MPLKKENLVMFSRFIEEKTKLFKSEKLNRKLSETEWHQWM